MTSSSVCGWQGRMRARLVRERIVKVCLVWVTWIYTAENCHFLFFNPHTTSLISDLSLCIIADNLTSVVQTSERGIHVHICHVYHLFMPGRKATPRVSTRSLGVVGLTDPSLTYRVLKGHGQTLGICVHWKYSILKQIHTLRNYIMTIGSCEQRWHVQYTEMLHPISL